MTRERGRDRRFVAEHRGGTLRITIEELPELDLAVARGPAGAEWHPMAVHTRTAAARLLLVHGSRVEFRYRYESWVQRPTC